tara:strand:+ start:12196 stop:13215 length:1020 start_codon:yes stop_codon:yes gene_type:complete
MPAKGSGKMTVVDLAQGTPEWLAWRCQGLTATDITIILGLSDYKTPWRLWAEKTGRLNPEDLSGNPNIERGNRLEDNARQLAETRYSELLLPVCGEYAEWRVLRASFDGLCRVNMPHEFKAPSDSVFDELKDAGIESQTYKMYESQVHAQCLVSGNDQGRLFFYLENGNDLEFPVTLTDERKAEILEKARWFWNLIETDTPPPLDPARDLYIPGNVEDRFRWDGYADAWRSNAQRVKALKVELDRYDKDQRKLQSLLISQMGEFMSTDVGGVKVSRFEKKGTVDYKQLLKDKFPDEDVDSMIEKYRKEPRAESRFTLSEDDLVNPDDTVIVTQVKAAYF